MWLRNLTFLSLSAVGVLALAGWLFPPRIGLPGAADPAEAPAVEPPPPVVAAVDAAFRREWAAAGLAPAGPADELTRLRRLTLALTGSTPSLQEVRRLQADHSPDRLSRRLEELLHDRRFADYFAERFARPLVGTDNGPFIIFRRRRFVSWLSDQFLANRPYDHIVRDLVAGSGLWTDRPEVNFVTATVDQDGTKLPDPVRLAGRTARAFLGVRMDCAQCHDHPFARWKQNDFHGLAAFFGQARHGLTGIRDDDSAEYSLEDRKTGKLNTVAAAVPLRSDLLPETGTRRERLAAWLTDPRNVRPARATVNRVWALMFGRPLVEPVDDIPDEPPAALRLLAEDFAANGFDLRRLIRNIAAAEVFALDSAADHEITDDHEAAWAVFPLTRLRPEQVAGGILSAASVQTVSSESHILVRFFKTVGENDFLKRYGDVGEDEFNSRAITIPQQLLLMNGRLVHEKTKDELLNASQQIAMMAPTDEAAVEAAYLAVLTRKPTPAESEHFAAKLAGSRGAERNRRLADVFWALINSTEFSCNH